jgi:Tfp pilus assembly protein PilO
MVVIMTVTWFLLVSPKRGEASQLQVDTESQLNENASLETDLAVLKEQNKKLPKYQAQLAELQSRIPTTSGMPTLIRQLTIAADRSGVEMSSLTPTLAVPLAPPGGTPGAVSPEGALPAGELSGINVDIVVTGGFFEIQQFVNKLENLDRYVQVSGFTIAEGDGATDQGSDASLTATFNSRVYLLPEGVDVTTATTTDPQS